MCSSILIGFFIAHAYVKVLGMNHNSDVQHFDDHFADKLVAKLLFDRGFLERVHGAKRAHGAVDASVWSQLSVDFDNTMLGKGKHSEPLVENKNLKDLSHDFVVGLSGTLTRNAATVADHVDAAALRVENAMLEKLGRLPPQDRMQKTLREKSRTHDMVTRNAAVVANHFDAATAHVENAIFEKLGRLRRCRKDGDVVKTALGLSAAAATAAAVVAHIGTQRMQAGEKGFDGAILYQFPQSRLVQMSSNSMNIAAAALIGLLAGIPIGMGKDSDDGFKSRNKQ